MRALFAAMRSTGAHATRPRRMRLATTTIVAALIAAFGLMSSAATAPAAHADTAATCGFATPGTGQYASTLCWFDLSGYDASQAGPGTGGTAGAGQPMTVDLPGGYTITFTLTVSGGVVAAKAFPTWSGSYLGNRGFYTGVPGKPALYQQTSGTVTTATLSDITVTDRDNRPITGYSFVGADAEATGPGESITWTADTPLSLISSLGSGAQAACQGGFTTSQGGTQVTCTGSNANTMNGTAILAAQAPHTFTQRMVGSGLEGVAFGVLVSTVQLQKRVVNGYAGDAFDVTASTPGGTVLGSASTSGGTAADTGPITVLGSTNGTQVVLAEASTTGTLDNYTGSWSCTDNLATPTAPLPSGDAGRSATVTLGIGEDVDCTITNTAIPSSLEIVKYAATTDENGDGLTDAGDTIQYTFTVTNTGQLTMDDVAVNDTLAGAVTCDATSLAPQQTTHCRATSPYTITANDQSTGYVDNTATATGVPVGTTQTITSPPSSTRTPLTAPAPALTLVKSVDPSDEADYRPGTMVTYHFVVTNTGNVTVNDIVINDSGFGGSGTLPRPTCPQTSLAVGAQMVCSAEYTLTDADVDNGAIGNTATATGTPTGSDTPVDSPPSSVTLPTPPQPGIGIVKTADPTTVDGAGQPIAYSFRVSNTGNVTLTGIHVDEAAFSGTGTLSGVDCPSAILVAGQAMTCTADYTTTQADADAGVVTNSATATGTPPTGAAITSDPSDARVTITRTPALTLSKTANVEAVAVGETITYSFLVTNTGTVTLTDPAIVEGDFSGTGTLSAIRCPSGTTLEPGDQVTCTATYTVSQADIDAGRLTNTATATGTPPSGLTPPVSPPSTSTLTTSPHPALSLVKTADTTSVSDIGQQVGYTFVVTNTGNVTISGTGVAEGAFSGHGTLSPVTCPPDRTTLGPGESVTCTAVYTVVAADLTGATLSNTATATGRTPGGDPVSSDPSTASVTSTASEALATTGGDAATPIAIAVMVVLLAGGTLLLIVWRRRGTTVR